MFNNDNSVKDFLNYIKTLEFRTSLYDLDVSDVKIIQRENAMKFPVLMIGIYFCTPHDNYKLELEINDEIVRSMYKDYKYLNVKTVRRIG